MSEHKQRMGLEELSQTPEYARLTQKQKLWLQTYVAGGLLDGNYDPIASTRTAYQTKSPEVARIMSYALLKSVHIIAVLNRHFQTEPIEAFLETIDRAINSRKVTMAQVQAMRLKSNVLGFTSGIPDRQPMAEAFKEAKVEAKKARKAKLKEERVIKPAEKSFYESEAERL